jgi:hypothetical protein
MERLRCAAVVIDATGRARQMNAPAQDLLGHDFNLVRGRPAARDAASNRRLQHLLSFALHAERGSAQAFAPIVVDRVEAPWLLVEAMPVTAFGSDLFSSGRVILLLTDLTAPLRPEATQLCAAFGLTIAEAKLAAKLASGVGIDGAAAWLGVSRETARTQLKAVFAKRTPAAKPNWPDSSLVFVLIRDLKSTAKTFRLGSILARSSSRLRMPGVCAFENVEAMSRIDV